MDSDFWHERWQNNRLGFHEGSVNRHLARHWAVIAGNDHSAVFVPLCGKAHDLAWLRERGHEVIGVEISPIACRDFFLERGIRPDVDEGSRFTRYAHDGITLLCGDFFDLTDADLPGIAFVYDRAAVIALPEYQRQAYVEQLNRVAPDAVHSLLITLDYPEQESFTGPPFNVSDREVSERFESTHRVERLAHRTLPDDDGLVRRGLRGGTESVFRLTRR